MRRMEARQGGQAGLNVQFTDIRYSLIDNKGGKEKQVLHQVSGEIKSGRLTAILGPSGAGKSSLLNVLSGFKTKGVTGSIKVNGLERNVDLFRKQSCYITQDQSLLPQLTARETLTVAANLKLQPGWEKNSSTSSVVSDIFELLGLMRIENTFVKHLSGGEKKRLAIGLELITNPPIMFFDEPTSGLDSSSSFQVINHLKALSAGGRAVVCVIHQPSSRIYQMFDDLYLVTEGRCLYSGSISNMVKVFEAAGFKCPDYYNRADFAIEVACRERGDDLSALFRRFTSTPDNVISQQQELHTTETTVMLPRDQRTVTVSIDTNQSLTYRQLDGTRSSERWMRTYPTSQLRQFNVLLKRAAKCIYRDLHMAQIRFACHVAMGLLLGLIYFGIGNEASKLESNSACLFFFQMFLFFSTAMPTVLTFPIEMSVFIREHLNNWYSLPAYYFSKLLANLPLQVMCPLVFILIGYYLTGQPNELCRVLMVVLPCLLLTFTAQALGMVLGAAGDEQLGVFLVPVTTIPMFLFSGFFLRLSDLPPYLRWIAEASYFKHGYEAVVLAVYGYDRQPLKCSQPYCHYKHPEKFLVDIGMKEQAYWTDIAGLASWGIGLHIALYFVLMWRVYKSK